MAARPKSWAGLTRRRVGEHVDFISCEEVRGYLALCLKACALKRKWDSTVNPSAYPCSVYERYAKFYNEEYDCWGMQQARMNGYDVLIRWLNTGKGVQPENSTTYNRRRKKRANFIVKLFQKNYLKRCQGRPFAGVAELQEASYGNLFER